MRQMKVCSFKMTSGSFPVSDQPDLLQPARVERTDLMRYNVFEEEEEEKKKDHLLDMW